MAARRHDPDRRQRIIDAAIDVARERGIDALSHRTVAAAADVPLGSTTYHFAGLDDLLVAALDQANNAWLDGLEQWERALPPDADLAAELAALIERTAAGDRQQVTLEYELYVAALRHERLRPLAAGCVDRLAGLLARRTPDRITAKALAALTDGLILQLLLTGRRADPAEVRELLGRLLR
ncbi:TetR family transcriptional regulator [Streptomyces durbertensis]|uniref:TetR family transcriptional regulator n=1 Tax=Streptomyces durbertensis TaxID=2448886 RepID=A0ABR6E9P0_9ACTN|nr:TetR family transcriptional regulator [Streptomyces durbertensis]MBB1242058.1 TetR family transcriptional regulator [Streptomyces durbertensis]